MAAGCALGSASVAGTSYIIRHTSNSLNPTRMYILHNSKKGVAGGASWDVPLELRCALDDNLTAWTETDIDYLFNVSWYRGML